MAEERIEKQIEVFEKPLQIPSNWRALSWHEVAARCE